MRRVWREICGIAMAVLTWWSVFTLVGFLGMFLIGYRDSQQFSLAGITMEPRNIPGNALGFIMALYAFRAVTRQRGQSDTAQARRPGSSA